METTKPVLHAPLPPFEGSDAAREFIGRLNDFVREELAPLAVEHGITSEIGAPTRGGPVSSPRTCGAKGDPLA